MSRKIIAPALEQVLEAVRRSTALSIRTVAPGIVVSYDATRNVASVQPAANTRLRDGSVRPTPQVFEAPVLFPAGAGFAVTWPLLPGDGVTLLVGDRDASGWRTGGVVYTPKTGRTHSLSDSFVYPGAGPSPNPIPGASPVDMVIVGPAGPMIRITPAGTISLVEGVLGVARATDPIMVDATTLAAINAMAGAFNAVSPGAPVLAVPVTPATGLGTITAGSTRVTAG
jgi:hypothetical protein